MKHFILNFLKDEEGLTMVEYAISARINELATDVTPAA